MDFFELIEKRSSCRAYEDRPVEDETLLRLAGAVRRAPSARNMQPWHLVFVRDAATRGEIATRVSGGGGLNAFAAQVPVFAVLCGQQEVAPPSALPRPKNDYTKNDLGIAAAYFLLAATELGLGSCVVGWFDEAEIRALLPVPEGHFVHALLAVGHPKGELAPPRPRKALEDMTTFV